LDSNFALTEGLEGVVHGNGNGNMALCLWQGALMQKQNHWCWNGVWHCILEVKMMCGMWRTKGPQLKYGEW